MKNDDYGFYGKGLDGYVHYRQGMQEAAQCTECVRRPPACLRRAENNRACTEIRRIRSDQQVDPAASAAYGVHDQLVYCADLRDY